MMKKIIVAILCCFSVSAYSETVQGGFESTVKELQIKLHSEIGDTEEKILADINDFDKRKSPRYNANIALMLAFSSHGDITEIQELLSYARCLVDFISHSNISLTDAMDLIKQVRNFEGLINAIQGGTFKMQETAVFFSNPEIYEANHEESQEKIKKVMQSLLNGIQYEKRIVDDIARFIDETLSKYRLRKEKNNTVEPNKKPVKSFY